MIAYNNFIKNVYFINDKNAWYCLSDSNIYIKKSMVVISDIQNSVRHFIILWNINNNSTSRLHGSFKSYLSGMQFIFLGFIKHIKISLYTEKIIRE